VDGDDDVPFVPLEEEADETSGTSPNGRARDQLRFKPARHAKDGAGLNENPWYSGLEGASVAHCYVSR